MQFKKIGTRIQKSFLVNKAILPQKELVISVLLGCTER